MCVIFLRRSLVNMFGQVVSTVFVASVALPLVIAQSQQGRAQEQCWLPSELRHSGAGQTILKDRFREAFKPLPSGVALPSTSGFAAMPGAIRRVDLSKGSEKLVALTFDLCEQAHERTIYQGSIVDILRASKVNATFFAGGKWLLNHEVRGGQLMADPLFEVANHAWEHRNLSVLEDIQLDDEIAGAQIAYERVRERLVARQCVARDGRRVREAAPARMSLFRFPFGACTPQALEAVSRNGLLAVQWDVSAGDASDKISARILARSVLARVKAGSIVLFHANGRGYKTAQALPGIIAKLRGRGFRFVTVSQLLGQPGGKPVVKPICYDSRPGDTDRHAGLGRHFEKRAARFYRRFKVDPKGDGTASKPKVPRPDRGPSNINPLALPAP